MSFALNESPFKPLRTVLGEARYADLVRRVQTRLSYSALIVFMGKTGVGKSSTCNALFGADLFKIDDVAACTRAVQLEELRIEDGRLTLVDVPGIGESIGRAEEYEALYRQILTEGIRAGTNGKPRPIDAVVWLLKADDRALEVESKFYRDVFRKHLTAEQQKRVVFAINQADKMEPIRTWDDEVRRPGAKQMDNLERKRQDVARHFEQESNLVIDYSANEGYNLDKLLERIVAVLPRDRIPLVVMQAEERQAETNVRTVSPEIAEVAQDTFWATVVDVAKEIGVHQLVTGAVKFAASAVKAIGGGIKSLWKAIF